jgi:CRISPR system Cascade subunit CasA
MDYFGYLHSFITGKNLQETIWHNILSEETIKLSAVYTNGIGLPPWEIDIKGEGSSESLKYKETVMAYLLPMNRFMLLAEDGLHYSEGFFVPGYRFGGNDPSAAIDNSGKKPRILWTDPQKRPWRSLTSLLSFIDAKSNIANYYCLLLKAGWKRLIKDDNREIGIWSGGLRVRSNAGEQYVSGTDDYVESEIKLDVKGLNELWFESFSIEMKKMEKLASNIYGCVAAYYRGQKSDGEKPAGLATSVFWQLSETFFQKLIYACYDESKEKLNAIRKEIYKATFIAYDRYCPDQTARQLELWAKNRPAINWYIEGIND